MRRLFPTYICACGLILATVFFSTPLQSAEVEIPRLDLPTPETTGGMSLRDAIGLRKSTRSFSNKPISNQELSNLLWATWGVTHPNNLRTIPTSNNKRSEQVYVALESGVWLYDAAHNQLELALKGDFRRRLGGAPVTLLYASPKDYYASGMHVGSLYQNAGLYCASVGLGNLVRRSGAESLNGVLQLPPGYKIFIIQSIGWPD